MKNVFTAFMIDLCTLQSGGFALFHDFFAISNESLVFGDCSSVSETDVTHDLVSLFDSIDGTSRVEICRD